MAGRVSSRGWQHIFKTWRGVGTVGVVGFGIGFSTARADMSNKQLTIPTPRTCCAVLHNPTPAQLGLANTLADIVGKAHVKEEHNLKGARIGNGTAFVFVQPGSLAEAVKVAEACVAANVAILPQGANTGLTGASVPRDDSDRPTVVINMRRLRSIQFADDGARVLCTAGAGIYDLSQVAKEIGRESHSVLGSIFLNPSVAAGLAFGSGGTKIRKGPVYTERALYLRVNEQGQTELVNELGIAGIPDGVTLTQGAGQDKAEEILCAVDKIAKEQESKLRTDPACARLASDTTYRRNVLNMDSNVSRSNADTRGPWPCRSEGKVMILASIHDTFPTPRRRRVIWISLPSHRVAAELKSKALLCDPDTIPASIEYMDETTVNTVDTAGRVLCLGIEMLGMGKALSKCWDLKLAVEGLPIPFFDVLPDKVMYWVNGLLPSPIPSALLGFVGNKKHHLLVEVCDFGESKGDKSDDEVIMERIRKFQAERPWGDILIHECNESEANAATRVRFSTAAAFKTMCVGRGLNGLSLDYAMPKNAVDAPPVPPLPPSDSNTGGHEYPVERLRYSHFGCNVVHEDIAYPPHVDVHHEKMFIKHAVEELGGRLPAEHGHGTEYKAPLDSRKRWEAMDPTNAFNPGVGGLASKRNYQA